MNRTWLDSHNEDNFMAQQRMAGQASAPTQQDALAGIVAAVREKAAAQFKATELRNPNDTVRTSIAEMARQHLEAYQRTAVAGGRPVLDRPRDELVLQIVDAILGLGELQSLLSMEGVEDIVINGPKETFVFKRGTWHPTPVKFGSESELTELINRAIAPSGRQVTPREPLCDAFLADGSRVNVAMTPVANPSPLITIRVFRKSVFEMEDWVRPSMSGASIKPEPLPLTDFAPLGWEGPLTPQAARFLEMATLADLNILVVGATGSGKTTMVQALARRKPYNRRMVVIEDTRELRIRSDESGTFNNCVYMTVRHPTAEGTEGVYQPALVKNALRMRPDCLTLGEARGGEMLDLLMALNTGHKGALTTLHANSLRDVQSRMGQMLQLADLKMPPSELVVARWIANAFHVGLFVELDHATRRRQVKEIVYFTGGVEASGVAQMQTLFTLENGQLRRTRFTIERDPFHAIGHSYAEVMAMDAQAPK